jgi:hypothetical protein
VPSPPPQRPRPPSRGIRRRFGAGRIGAGARRREGQG